MISLQNYILESTSNKLEQAKQFIKDILSKNYNEDEYRITFGYGHEIRVYFTKASHNEVSKMGQRIDNELRKYNIGMSHKTMGQNNNGEHYQLFK